MSILEFENKHVDIITDYDKLSVRSDEIDIKKNGSRISPIIVNMKNILRNDDSIKGISAIQLNEPDRIICINFNGNIKTFVNPIIDNCTGMTLSIETCHSIPDKRYLRVRNTNISVTYQTPLGKIEHTELTGMAAYVMQHHIDHLNGVLLNDVGFEIDDDWDSLTSEEQEEIISYYLDSIDMTAEQLTKEALEDKETKMTYDAVKFMESVKSGQTKIEKVPITDEEFEVLKQYVESKENDNG